MAQTSGWNAYPSVLPEDGHRVLVKYKNEMGNGAQAIGIFQYVGAEDSFKNADGAALKKETVEAWAPLP